MRVAARESGLALSDVALGVRGASALWLPAPGDTVHLTPFDLFREGGAVELYYELTGAAPGASYRHRIAVFRLKGNPPEAEGRPVVTLAFEERAADPLIRSSRTLQLGRLKSGRYVVEVQVTDLDGNVKTRMVAGTSTGHRAREPGASRFRLGAQEPSSNKRRQSAITSRLKKQ